MIDMSAAFDTVDHGILLKRLDRMFCIRGGSLQWFKSYRTDCTNIVNIGNDSSSPLLRRYGVLQGSVLGPLLFILYSAQIGDIIQSNDLAPFAYADDSQAYFHCNRSEVTSLKTSRFHYRNVNKCLI